MPDHSETERERWLASLERRFRTADLPGGVSRSELSPLWDALGEEQVHFAAKAWSDDREGWLVVTPRGVLFVAAGDMRVNIDFQDLLAVDVHTPRWPKSLLHGPRLCLESNDGATYTFDTVWHAEARNAIEDARLHPES